MATGIVVSWNGSNGHIQDDSDQQRCFFGDRMLRGLHPDEMEIGLAVEFDRSQNERGPTARNVRRRAVGSSPTPPVASAPMTLSGNPKAPKMGMVGGNQPRKLQVETLSQEEILSHLPVPDTLRTLLNTLDSDRQRHPGLMLDRFLQPCKQEQQKAVLEKVASLPGDEVLLKEQFTRREEMLRTLRAIPWSRTTAGPLTLHLARASALENAGICLHPIYGFTYLPGTGLKGLARAYAETVWLKDQPNPVLAWQQIEAVFGWAPNSDLIGRSPKPWKPEGVPPHGDKDAAAAGNIIFHDAWPEKWPRLIVDIVNNHYPQYYRGEEPPGDWQSPNPVYFLAVKPNTSFQFALSKRRDDTSEECLKLAQHWLDGALTLLGCGAKTAAGYGAFSPTANTPKPIYASKYEEVFTLELVTPAFLAGASQKQEDCDLRPATLRGLLRWWWRAMHAGYVDVPTLRDLEAAIWGDTNTGGAVTLRVERAGAKVIPSPYKRMNFNNKKNKEELVFDGQFAKQHGIPNYSFGQTPGLAYAGYGMDEMTNLGGITQRRQRYCAEAGSRWKVTLLARPGQYHQRGLDGKVLRTVRLDDPQLLLRQAKAALWWFCTLGGAGSKSRNGFGSFALPPELDKVFGAGFISLGKELRNACGLPELAFDTLRVEGASIKRMRELATAVIGQRNELPGWSHVETKNNDPWYVLDLIGYAMQKVAQGDASTGMGKHCPQKRGLGLPRKIHGPNKKPIGKQTAATHQPPISLNAACGDRHASPVLFHVSKEKKGLMIHIAGFPTADLREPGQQSAPGLAQHQDFLKRYLHAIADELQKELNQG
jgi:CRISPR-associated protein Cmr6